MMSGRFHRLRFRVPSQAEELLSAWLWARGTAGIEQQDMAPGESIWIASFAREKPLVKEDLADLEALMPGVEFLDSGLVEETDWLEAWRAAAAPIFLGERLFVDPREWELAPQAPSSTRTGGADAFGASAGRFVLQIPARTAFGVGSHESTRLAYELLEATELSDRRVLDVGCGSGILAMAALLLGARDAVGFDFDPAAALLAGQYARHNRVRPKLYTGTIAALARHGGFEVVVLNVLPHEIAGELGQVIEKLAPGGELLVSGVLADESRAVEQSIARFGCDKVVEIRAGEWLGLRFRKRTGHATTSP